MLLLGADAIIGELYVAAFRRNQPRRILFVQCCLFSSPTSETRLASRFSPRVGARNTWRTSRNRQIHSKSGHLRLASKARLIFSENLKKRTREIERLKASFFATTSTDCYFAHGCSFRFLLFFPFCPSTVSRHSRRKSEGAFKLISSRRLIFARYSRPRVNYCYLRPDEQRVFANEATRATAFGSGDQSVCQRVHYLKLHRSGRVQVILSMPTGTVETDNTPASIAFQDEIDYRGRGGKETSIVRNINVSRENKRREEAKENFTRSEGAREMGGERKLHEERANERSRSRELKPARAPSHTSRSRKPRCDASLSSRFFLPPSNTST